MTTRARVHWVWLATACSHFGCNAHVYSPPARVLPIETPHTLAPDESRIGLETGPSGAVFGPGLWTGTVRFRHPVRSDTEANLEATAMFVTSGGTAPAHRGIYAVRAGVKKEVTAAFAVAAGVGGGASAGGGFVTPDVGAVLAAENPYFVPFLSGRGYLSEPVFAADVDLGERGLRRPTATVGAAAAAGFRVPLGSAEAEPGSVGAAFGFTTMADADQHETQFSLGVGGEVAF